MNNDINTSIFWNDKYLNREHAWDIGCVTPLFIEKEKTFKKKSNILVPGCGLGHDALYFAKKNHIVDALDFSEYAIKFILKTSKENKIKINPIKSDYFNFKNEHYLKYDYIIEYTFFCAIERSKRTLYAEKCYKLLKDGGVLKGIFLPLNKESSNNPPYQVTMNDIKRTFSKLFNIIKIETNINSIPQRLGNEVYIEMVKK